MSFYRVYDQKNQRAVGGVHQSLTKAMGSLQYLSSQHGYHFEVLAVVYTSDDYANEQHDARRQAEMDRYGTD
jgi:hypothetical protein